MAMAMMNSLKRNEPRNRSNLHTAFFSGIVMFMLTAASINFIKLAFLPDDSAERKHHGTRASLKHALLHFKLSSLTNNKTSSLKKKTEKTDAMESGVRGNDRVNDLTKEEETTQGEEDWGSETAVFRQMLLRATSSLESCNSLDKSDAGDLQRITNSTLLPEFGIIDAIQTWFSNDQKSQCHLPPSTSCNVTGWSVVLMSYAGSEKHNKMKKGIADLTSRNETKEIILVWNSPKNTLTDRHLQTWNDDANHPLRIFYALENGLENNLFNRYHPSIEPKMEALLYFDDDGPFFKPRPVQAGFQLWKRNSGVQVGCFPRNIRFLNPDRRMQSMMEEEIKVSVRQVLQGWQAVSPYDTQGTKMALQTINNNNNDDDNEDPALNRHPRFIPSCRSKGDTFQYNWHHFAPFQAHMTLPSGTFLHRNFLCFLWHPVFQDLRKFVLEHPTHPDDLSTSTIVSHLAGKSLRTYTRRTRTQKRDDVIKENNKQKEEQVMQEKKQRKKQRNKHPTTEQIKIEDNDAKSSNALMHQNKTVAQNQLRRKLLWKNNDWGNLRTEAINSIIDYFGSINPGSVGYCLGTNHFIPSKMECDHEDVAIWEDVPWMWEGQLGYDQC